MADFVGLFEVLGDTLSSSAVDALQSLAKIPGVEDASWGFTYTTSRSLNFNFGVNLRLSTTNSLNGFSESTVFRSMVSALGSVDELIVCCESTRLKGRATGPISSSGECVTHIVLPLCTQALRTAPDLQSAAEILLDIPGVEDLSIGASSAPRCLIIVRFTSAEAEEAYRDHPIHIDYKKWLVPNVDTNAQKEDGRKIPIVAVDFASPRVSAVPPTPVSNL
jgi:hypothetical protein